MDISRYHKTRIGNHALRQETLMLGYGYDPALSEGSAKPPVFLTSTFVFRTAEDGRDFFDYTAGRREPPAEGRSRRERTAQHLRFESAHYDFPAGHCNSSGIIPKARAPGIGTAMACRVSLIVGRRRPRLDERGRRVMRRRAQRRVITMPFDGADIG
jgi:hypothetical protein